MRKLLAFLLCLLASPLAAQANCKTLTTSWTNLAGKKGTVTVGDTVRYWQTQTDSVVTRCVLAKATTPPPTDTVVTPPPPPPDTTTPPPGGPFAAPDLHVMTFDDASQFSRFQTNGGPSFPNATVWHKLDATGGRNGSAAMRITITSGSAYEPVGLTWPARGRVFVRWYQRTSGTFSSSGNVKGPRFQSNWSNLGVLKQEMLNWGFDTEGQAVQVTTGMYQGAQAAAEAGYVVQGCTNLNNGAWHSIEVDYNRNAGGNVEARFWCDGKAMVLRAGASSWGGGNFADIQYVGGDVATNVPTTIRATRQASSTLTGVTFWETISQGFAATVWVDDVAVSSQRIGP